MIEKKKTARIRGDIRRVLMDVWDPIGVKDIPQAQDEYDDYVDGVYDLLIGGSSDHDIETHLWLIAFRRHKVTHDRYRQSSPTDFAASKFKIAR